MTPARPPSDGSARSSETPLSRCPRPMRWMEYLDGAIAPGAERTALRAHLAGCARCRGEVESLRAADSSLRAADPAGSGPMPIESFLAAVKRRAASPESATPEPEPRRRIASLTAFNSFGAACALAVAAALLVAAALWRNEGGGDTPPPSPVADTDASNAAPPLAADAGAPAPDDLDPIASERSTAAEALAPGLPLPEEVAAFAAAAAAVRTRLSAAAGAPDAATHAAEIAAVRASLREFPSLAPRLFEGLDRAAAIAAFEIAGTSRDPLVADAVVRAADELGAVAEGAAALATMKTDRALAALAAFAARPGDPGRAAILSLASVAATSERESAALTALARLAGDTTTPERASAVAAIASLESPAADRNLLAILLRDPAHPDVAAAAASRRASLWPSLVESLERSRGDERARSLAALAGLADESSIPFLRRHASRGSRYAAESAAVLAAIPGEESAEMLIALRADAAPEVRKAAAAAIGSRGDEAVAFAERALDGPLATGALEALADARTDAAIDALARALRRPGLSVAAAEALGRTPGDAATAALLAGARSGAAACRRELVRRGDDAALLALGNSSLRPGSLAGDAVLGRRRDENSTLAPPSTGRDTEPIDAERASRPSVVRRPGSRHEAPPPNLPAPERRPPRR